MLTFSFQIVAVSSGETMALSSMMPFRRLMIPLPLSRSAFDETLHDLIAFIQC